MILFIDSVVNLLLGIIILLFPLGIDALLGLPEASNYFYTTILGAVLVGIAIALFIETFWQHKGIRGLGLSGAIAINLCGGTAIVLWLIFGTLSIPTHGKVILWLVAVLVILIGFIELLIKPAK
jgi:hypothetical protein